MNSAKSLKTDVVIVGSGVAGLYAAMNLPGKLNVTIISKGDVTQCDSYLAQGGICMLRDDSDYDSYFEDTMRAGHYENDPDSVDQMIRQSQSVIKDLISVGTDFERNADGSLDFTREGAHSNKRILYHEDITGQEITSKLLDAVRKLPNVTIYDHVTMIDIITKKSSHLNDSSCHGIVCTVSKDSELAQKYGRDDTISGEKIVYIESFYTILACGGIGGLFEHSTNYPLLTGDALAICLKHGIELENPDYIQIHPTTLYTDHSSLYVEHIDGSRTKRSQDEVLSDRSFLISESVRGEGGILLNNKGQRFTDELMPRDVVSNAIFEQMKKEGTKHVWLSMENIPTDVIKNHFKHIYEQCLKEGYDCTKEPIPVVPAQHYFMGGIKVDLNGQTSMRHLFAAGETCCNGVHGRNRLASNSLLESLVWARKAANLIGIKYDIRVVKNDSSSNSLENENLVTEVLPEWTDDMTLKVNNKNLILAEIERMKKYHEHNKPKQYSTPCTGNYETSGRRPDPVSA
ncbi:MAG: L-aspartate oxidase [Butyrivibrio sp.]|uniref:L-aspartate oxidase n=1 Tax=Butyrivibrio sp. TaxID=28121 RepID=UPI0025DBA50A|nr:L-aspartate oxidase [Butyrivibrio sp.]MCR5772618.1 L-aspartate oxidase [Butyrivibrio sp.]